MVSVRAIGQAALVETILLLSLNKVYHALKERVTAAATALRS